MLNVGRKFFLKNQSQVKWKSYRESIMLGQEYWRLENWENQTMRSRVWRYPDFFRYRYFFPVPVPVLFSGTCNGTLFRDQFFPVPIPVPPKSTCTKFPGIFRYRHQIFPILIPVIFSGTKFFRHRYHPKRNRDVTFCWEDWEAFAILTNYPFQEWGGWKMYSTLATAGKCSVSEIW